MDLEVFAGETSKDITFTNFKSNGFRSYCWGTSESITITKYIE